MLLSKEIITNLRKMIKNEACERSPGIGFTARSG